MPVSGGVEQGGVRDEGEGPLKRCEVSTLCSASVLLHRRDLVGVRPYNQVTEAKGGLAADAN